MAEAGLQDTPWFQALSLARMDRQLPRAQLSRDAVLHAGSTQVSDISISASVADTCVFFPNRDMVNYFACRDEKYVTHFGSAAKCPPLNGSCVVKGFVCCVVLHAYAEKLEFVSGIRWDLPCDCGLSHCATCCSGGRCTSLTDNDLPSMNMPYWTLSYNSDMLRGLASGALTPAKAWEVCEAFVWLRHSERGLDALRLCDAVITGFLKAAKATTGWPAFAHRLRRSMRGRGAARSSAGLPGSSLASQA